MREGEGLWVGLWVAVVAVWSAVGCWLVPWSASVVGPVWAMRDAAGLGGAVGVADV